MSLFDFSVFKPTLSDHLKNDIRILERSLEVQFSDRRYSIHKTDESFNVSRNATLKRLFAKRVELSKLNAGQGG